MTREEWLKTLKAGEKFRRVFLDLTSFLEFSDSDESFRPD